MRIGCRPLFSLGALLTLSLTPGCYGRDESLYSLGSFLFLIFLAVIAMTYLIKHLHNNEQVARFIVRLRAPAIVLSWLVFATASVTLIAGSLVLWDDDFAPEKLTFFLGVILFLLAYYVRQWALSSLEKKGHYARLASMSIGFAFAMLYIILGAKAIRV